MRVREGVLVVVSSLLVVVSSLLVVCEGFCEGFARQRFR